MAGRYRNVCFTLNNPEDMIMFDDSMEYLVYQEEVGDSGTYHFQGYCEFAKQVTLQQAKNHLGATVHIERRRGSQAEAIAYCKKDGRVGGPYEDGEPRTQGKRTDLEGFKGEVMNGAKMRDLLDDHYGVIARYPKFYTTLTQMNRPKRTTDLVVHLLIGETGTGKTRYVESLHGTSDNFWRMPLNNGTMWFDSYDGQGVVLLDDFSGKASHFTLCSLLQLLDRYPVAVPTKGSHTWWMPDEVFVTSNVLPRDWYSWKDRGEQYKALARRFHKVSVYTLSLSGTDRSISHEEREWWINNKPDEVLYINGV